jgi:hypothetical protein
LSQRPKPPPVPADLRALLARGLTWGGTPLARVVCYAADGAVVADAAPPPAEKDWARTAPGEAALLTLAASPRPLTGRQLARAAGYSGYSGSFREALAGLSRAGQIIRDGDGFFSLATPYPS